MTDIELQYNYCLQSVSLINTLKIKTNRTLDEDFSLLANIDYLTEMISSPIWTTQDLTPLRNAIT
jgi:hypothetical protein